MKRAATIFILTVSAINIFGLWRSYQKQGDICPLICVYHNSLGAEWAETEIFGQHTIWKNAEAKREIAESDKWWESFR